jgi:hypothetical protein
MKLANETTDSSRLTRVGDRRAGLDLRKLNEHIT